VNSRPRRLVLVTGTGTEIGKTWFAAATLELLRERGARVAARKPVQSFDPGDASTDADVLAAATGDHPDAVCLPHRSLAVPMAPPMAVDALGRQPFTIAELAAELCWPDGVEVGLVEGVGGPRSPIAADGDTVDLADKIHPDVVVLVADAGLGTINAVRLSASPFDSYELVVALNRYDEREALHRRNRDWLSDRDGFEIVVSARDLAARLPG
jgi:dethiobiotin synthetase